MVKIAFTGAGSTVFVRNIIGDCMYMDSLKDAEIALYDIDPQRLKESAKILSVMNANINDGRMKIRTYCGPANRKKALKNADFVVNAIQVGGYKPSTVIDFEIPKKYGLRQTIADTLGIGGIFRSLRTIPVMLDFAHDMEEVCPNALFLNYSNPMAMLTGAVLHGSGIQTVGLCHSVQVCVRSLLNTVRGLTHEEIDKLTITDKIAGINHMAWLLDFRCDGKDIYDEIRAEAKALVPKLCRAKKNKSGNIVRLEIMNKFGYYVTESSEHNAEYTPYWIKSQYPELITKYNIPLDEYPRRCVNQIAAWKKQYKEILADPHLTRTLSREYGARIMNAVVTDTPYRINGNVLNRGYIENLPSDAVVEVPCLVDSRGVHGTVIGRLPTQCAALNMTNVNPQLLTIEAALTRKKDTVYQAAMLDPHTAAELPIDKIVAMCDDLFKAHGNMIPKYR